MRRYLWDNLAGFVFAAATLGVVATMVKGCVAVDTRGRPLQELWEPHFCPQCRQRMTMFEIYGRTEAHCLRCHPDLDFLPVELREAHPDPEN
jgi:hypothetical protein